MRFDMLHSYGDCTSSYNIVLDKSYTVEEFINTIFNERNNEWGTIDIFSHYSRAYNKGKFTYNTFEQCLLDKKIKKVTGHGGWTNMDYVIYI